MENALQNYTLPYSVQLIVDTETKAANAITLLPILTAALQMVITQILMSPEVASTLPSWLAKSFLPISTIGVLINFICSIVTVAYLYSLGDVVLAARDLVINDPSSLPFRVFMRGESIPIDLLRSSAIKNLLLVFGFPRQTIHHGTIAVVLFHISGSILALTTSLIIYHNIFPRRSRRANQSSFELRNTRTATIPNHRPILPPVHTESIDSFHPFPHSKLKLSPP
ncbi:hypothetical protein CPB86DRAFT_48029 [Serendipita vermifera]|nr:hypothetical protein CPB86DRAFT_48029 [Serendipita vermifera]